VEAQLKRNKKWKRKRKWWKKWPRGCRWQLNQIRVLKCGRSACSIRCAPHQAQSLEIPYSCNKEYCDPAEAGACPLVPLLSCAVWWQVMAGNKSTELNCLWKQVEVKRGLSSACDIIFVPYSPVRARGTSKTFLQQLLIEYSVASAALSESEQTHL